MDLREIIEAAYADAAEKAGQAKQWVGEKVQGVQDFLRPPLPPGQPDYRGLPIETVTGLKQLDQQTAPPVEAPPAQVGRDYTADIAAARAAPQIAPTDEQMLAEGRRLQAAIDAAKALRQQR